MQNTTTAGVIYRLLVRCDQLLGRVKQIIHCICGLLSPREQLSHHLTGSTARHILGLVEQEVDAGILASDIEVLDPGANVLFSSQRASRSDSHHQR
jgi:hypothetical protein